MNRLIFICHVREDEGGIAKSLAKSLAARGLKVVYRSISPWPASEQPNGLVREAVETGLLECCYGVILLSQAFLERNWPSSELNAVISRVVNGEERLIHVRHGVSASDIAGISPRLALRHTISLDISHDQAANAIFNRCAKDRSRNETFGLGTLPNPKSLALFGCRECRSQADLSLECLTAPPLGTSGVLICTRCGRGYPIRNGIPQLLSEGAFNPDEPRPPDIEPLIDLDSISPPVSE
jgi:uncharacterized protein YbaR (Trm112 family)